MAEHRPYRVTSRSARARLLRVKLVSLTLFCAAALVINSRATQLAAHMFGDAPQLGSGVFGFYAPWEWIVWWSRWYRAEQLQPVWEQCVIQVALPLLVAFVVAIGVINLTRWWLRDTTPDLHGSARWARPRDVRKSGFLAPQRYLPLWLRRQLVRVRLLKPSKRRCGIYLGAWWSRGKLHYLRDCGETHVLIEAPSRSGKGVNSVQPTMVTWPHSAVVYDLKGELWRLSAGARKRMGQLCLKFSPADADDPGVKYNPLDDVRLGTVYEVADAQNIAQMMVDPHGAGVDSDEYWVTTGIALFSAAILHVLYTEPVKSLRGVIGMLSDPDLTIGDVIHQMMTTEHDPIGARGWRTGRGKATRTHPVVAESLREVLEKAEKERSGVIGQVVSKLPIYRDPLIASATEYSDFRIDDLVNHERPATLYLMVPDVHRERMVPLIRLMIMQIVRRLSEKLAYRNGRAVSPHRRPLLLMLDEFDRLGHFEKLADAMNHMAVYGIRACLVLQSLNQIYATYGANQSITDNCATVVRFTPNSLDNAERMSRSVGQTSVRHDHRTRSGGGETVSHPEVGRPLMTSDEVLRMDLDEVLIFARGHRTIRASVLKHYEHPYFSRLTMIEPPAKTDRMSLGQNGAASAKAQWGQSPDWSAPSSENNKPPTADPSPQRPSFLNSAAIDAVGKDFPKGPGDGKERLV
jgi:type IV secretion system protein VirD4